MKTLTTYRGTASIVLVLVLISLTFFLFRPLPRATLQNCDRAIGQLIHVEEGGTHDIVFKLKDDNDTYYINRGLEQGLTLEAMKQLEGKQIALYYVEHWSPFDAMHQVRHIAKVAVGKSIVYNEIEE